MHLDLLIIPQSGGKMFSRWDLQAADNTKPLFCKNTKKKLLSQGI